MSELLIFSCDNNYYAFDAKSVERVLRAVEITSLPGHFSALLGVFDLHGKTIPAVSLRRLLGLKEKSVELEDMLIVIQAGKRLCAFLSDNVEGVFTCEEDESTDANELFGDIAIKKILKWEERLVPLLDIEGLIGEELFVHMEKNS